MQAASATRDQCDRIAALRESGQFKQALARCEKARRRYPEDIKLLGLLASIHSAMSNAEGLHNTLRKAGKLASRHFRAGRLEPAEDLCRLQLHYHRDEVGALRILGLIAGSAGAHEDAEKLLTRALELAPEQLQLKYELADILKHLDQLEQAAGHYRQLLLQHPGEARACYQLAAVLAALGRPAEAEAAYAQCLELEPSHVGALLGLGHMLKAQGKQQAGIAAYQRAIALYPENGATWHSLSNLKTYRFSEEQMAQMRHLVAQENVRDTSSEASFHYTLAKALEDHQQYDEAWAHYERGCALMQQLVPYSSRDNRAATDAIIEFFTPEFFRTRQGFGDADDAPVFIVGMPRSGSTLVEQILASHSRVEGTSELPFVGRLIRSLNDGPGANERYPRTLGALEARQYRQLGQHYLHKSAVHRRTTAPYFLDKMPNNFTAIGFIHCILPNARFIDVRRNPMDVCVANLKHLYARGQGFSYRQSDMAQYYLDYRRLMAHWDNVLPGLVHAVQYEDLVADLEPQVRRLLQHLDLPWEDNCLNFHQTQRAVHTASSEQVRQPVYDTAVGFWRNYAPHLDELGRWLNAEPEEA